MDREQLVRYAAILADAQQSAYGSAVKEYSLYADKYNIPIEMIAGFGREKISGKIATQKQIKEGTKLKKGERVMIVRGRPAIFNGKDKFVRWK